MKFHLELGCGVEGRGVANKWTGWVRSSETDLGFNIGIIKL